MKTITLEFTAEDLAGDMSNIRTCAGYCAAKRKIPSLRYWAPSYRYGVLETTKDGKCFQVNIPQEFANKLHKHAIWQWYQSNPNMEREPTFVEEKAEPFSCLCEVPDDVETVE